MALPFLQLLLKYHTITEKSLRLRLTAKRVKIKGGKSDRYRPAEGYIHRSPVFR